MTTAGQESELIADLPYKAGHLTRRFDVNEILPASYTSFTFCSRGGNFLFKDEKGGLGINKPFAVFLPLPARLFNPEQECIFQKFTTLRRRSGNEPWASAAMAGPL